MIKDKTLKFIKININCYHIVNHNNQVLGRISRRRIKYYYHWVFEPVSFKRVGDLWFLNTRLREIVEAISKLYKGGNIE